MGLLMCSSIEYVEGVIECCRVGRTQNTLMWSQVLLSWLRRPALLSHDLSLLIACTSITLSVQVLLSTILPSLPNIRTE
jgi:hypothetical protein